MSAPRSLRSRLRSTSRSRRLVLLALAVLVAWIVLTLIVDWLGGNDGFSVVDPDNPRRSYVAVFLLIALDAVIPVFPGETTLNAAATAASQGTLDLVPVIVAGALGAIVGDSALYWIARRYTTRIEPQLQKAQQNPKIAEALTLLHGNAALLIVGGRFVPGMRFLVNATMGISKFPYRRFLLWSAIGGILWSAYTCLLAYAVGTALAGFPLASVVISGVITSIVIAAVFIVVRRQKREIESPTATDSGTPVGLEIQMELPGEEAK
jgi:membrane protein DedA with SNARE-associated domain